MGQGDPIVLLHGNPTSSFLWRDVMPPLAAQFAALIGDQRVTLVLHDWGSASGFHSARLHPQQVRGIAYMAGIVMPLPGWDDRPQKARGVFQGFRSPKGQDLVLKRNLFIEGVLPRSILRKPSDEEMAVHRAPFTRQEDGQPMLNWPRQIPTVGEPPSVVALVQQCADWLSASNVTKLFVNAEPGSILVGAQREFCRSWPNQQETTVPGLHFIQEDSGMAIGQAVAALQSELNSRD